MTDLRRAVLALAALPTAWVLAAVAVAFAALTPKFLTPDNLTNILIQSAATGILATGMLFVLVTAGIDLAVGAVMFLGAAACGWLAGRGLPGWAAVAALLAVGPACGLVHGLLVTRVGVIPFVVTLSSQFVYRGAGVWVTGTKDTKMPDALQEFVSGRALGVPVPVLVWAGVLLAGQWVLGRTVFGRQAAAVGHDPAAARKAGVNVSGVLTRVYVLSGTLAAVAGLVAVGQLGTASTSFGQGREFDAIAAAVLGGASLYGGRGSVLPGVLIGAVTIQTVFNGLNLVNANPYAYPLITGGVVFSAVLADSLRNRRRGAGR